MRSGEPVKPARYWGLIPLKKDETWRVGGIIFLVVNSEGRKGRKGKAKKRRHERQERESGKEKVVKAGKGKQEREGSKGI
jgi:hypothetical protein